MSVVSSFIYRSPLDEIVVRGFPPCRLGQSPLKAAKLVQHRTIALQGSTLLPVGSDQLLDSLPLLFRSSNDKAPCPLLFFTVCLLFHLCLSADRNEISSTISINLSIQVLKTISTDVLRVLATENRKGTFS